MDARNLGIVFGPAVLRRREETPQQLIRDSPLLIGLVSHWIEEVDTYFPSTAITNNSNNSNIATLSHHSPPSYPLPRPPSLSSSSSSINSNNTTTSSDIVMSDAAVLSPTRSKPTNIKDNTNNSNNSNNANPTSKTVWTMGNTKVGSPMTTIQPSGKISWKKRNYKIIEIVFNSDQ